MFTFLHAADLHLDTPFSSVGGRGMPDGIARVLREASLRAWDALVDTAIQRGVAFVLLAGDIYDGPERGIRAQLAFRDGLARLDAAGIRSFIVHGNHDPVNEGWTAIDRLPALAHRFAPAGSAGEAPEAVSFEAGGEAVTVHGISYAVRTTTENLALRFPAKTGAGFHVGLLHANVGASADHDPYSPATVAELQTRGIDYWALGHVHTRATLHAGAPWVVYPGNLQGRTPRPAEQGAKGAVLVTVDRGTATEPELIPLDIVRFADVSVDITDLNSAGELIDRLQEAGDPGEHDGRSVILRATVTGTGPVHEELVAATRRDEIIEALRPIAATEPFSWCDRIDWKTRPALDLGEVRRGNDFLSDLLATAESPPAERDWRSGLPKIPADVARYLDTQLDPAGPDVAGRALDLALNELTGGPA